jgi:predicted metal-dependent phosphoesterase TrpH
LKVNLDLHIHSSFSPDSRVTPGEIIRLAKQRGLDGVAIADHNTVQGGLAALEINADPDFIVIPGAEYSTEYGHVVGLFLSEEIDVQGRKPKGYTLSPTLPLGEVVQAIHAQGGIAVLAHPFQSRLSLPAHVFEGPVKVDAIEGFNSRAGTRTNPDANAHAAQCAKEYDIPALGGSDAHLPWEIGRAYTRIDLRGVSKEDVCLRECHSLVRAAILEGRVEYFGRETQRAVVPLTEIVKARKRKTYCRMPYLVLKLILASLGPVGLWLENALGEQGNAKKPKTKAE